MTSRSPGTQPSIMTDDEFWLVILGVAAFPTLVAAAVQAWKQGASWLVQHQILVPASAHPLVPLPTMQGAGLDIARLSILAGALVLVGVFTTLGVRALVHRRIQ